MLYPSRCPLCDQVVTGTKDTTCTACHLKIPFIKEPACKKCGKEMEDSSEEYCSDCKQRTHQFSYGVALLNYTIEVKASIARYKYQNVRSHAPWYGEQMAKHLNSRIVNMKPDILVPVPLHRKKQNIRGYNQSELLANELGTRLNIPTAPDLLVRNKETKALKSLSYIQRKIQLNSSFKLNQSFNYSIEGIQRILLIDDIYTTGSTLDACAKALKESADIEVFFAVLAIGKS